MATSVHEVADGVDRIAGGRAGGGRGTPRVASMTMQRALAAALLLTLLGGCAGRASTPRGGTAAARTPDVIWVPSPPEVIAAMLQLAEVSPVDVVYDLGSGEGEIVIEAARRYGVRAVGVELDHERVQSAEKNAADAGVTSRVTFVERDLFEVDISEATVVTLYLLTDLNRKLRPKLWRDLRPGTRVVSHAFSMGEDWKPVRQESVQGTTVYLWHVPPHKG
jgi:SAM-dependent methyltransferase